ncbi:transposase-like protein [Corynebacterium diphtheriae HC03]|nr:transposase-like protein [Corynebacterium diphtheriae HC03]
MSKPSIHNQGPTVQPNENAIVIEAEPINECPKCGQPGVLRDHVIRSLVDLPIVGYPTRLHVRLPRHQRTNKHCLQKIFHAGLSHCSRRDLQRRALPRRGHGHRC